MNDIKLFFKLKLLFITYITFFNTITSVNIQYYCKIYITKLRNPICKM